MSTKDTRSHNVGNSDYAKHKIQPWDIWEEYNLNPWDADIVKRILRTKKGEDRKLDYEKIVHICQERIRQLDEAEQANSLKFKEGIKEAAKHVRTLANIPAFTEVIKAAARAQEAAATHKANMAISFGQAIDEAMRNGTWPRPRYPQGTFKAPEIKWPLSVPASMVEKSYFYEWLQMCAEDRTALANLNYGMDFGNGPDTTVYEFRKMENGKYLTKEEALAKTAPLPEGDFVMHIKTERNSERIEQLKQFAADLDCKNHKHDFPLYARWCVNCGAQR